jgi:hypothetical protein
MAIMAIGCVNGENGSFAIGDKKFCLCRLKGAYNGNKSHLHYSFTAEARYEFPLVLLTVDFTHPF